MPLWSWLFLITCITYFAFVLWRACNKKYFKAGPIIYSLDQDPIYFWFFAFVFTASELIALALFGIAAVSVIWGPIFHQ